ncbi:MAG: agmatine deiminase family protein [Candidatus Micrarchaeota archaeon]
MEKTPRELGYQMPAEWEAHDATWVSWPKNPETFPKSIIGKVEEAYCQIVNAISEGETVKILVDDEKSKMHASKLLEKSGCRMENIQFKLIKTADVWARDYGPTFILNRKTKQRAAVKWQFNAWGNKYTDLLFDNGTGEKIIEDCKIDYFEPDFVMEGGSIDVNGNGELLTTKQCLLNKNRNPDLSQKEIEAYLKSFLGVDRIIWLNKGIEGDDTDGHIDDIARFVSKNKIAIASSNKNDADGRALLENCKILKSETDFEIIKLPMPAKIIDKEENRQLPASYANFYITNKTVLLPVFDDKADKDVIALLESLFSGREVIPIPSKDLVYGYGSVHCITQQEPKI